MGEYVEIKRSPAGIMNIGNRIRASGENLRETVRGINQDIVTHESNADTFPSDQFTDGFLPKYQAPVVDGEGHTKPTNQAVRDSAEYCGTKLSEIGGFIGKAMMNYEATDDDSGEDISKTAL